MGEAIACAHLREQCLPLHVPSLARAGQTRGRPHFPLHDSMEAKGSDGKFAPLPLIQHVPALQVAPHQEPLKEGLHQGQEEKEEEGDDL